MKTKKELTAPCGLDCFNCFVYEKNITATMRTRVAQTLNIPEEKVDCRGCREQKGCVLHMTSCATLDCVTKKGVNFCFECGDFPCPKLQPVKDGADKYPHNMKLYNLCRMKKIGVEKWAEEEAFVIRQKYFNGKFVAGQGPRLE
jgi:hypothetical protein